MKQQEALTAASSFSSLLERLFQLSERGTSVRRELLAGLTTFLSMAYVLFVVPQVLGEAGMPKESVFVATALAAAVGTLIMGLYANYPVAQAPGMGLLAFFAYSVVLGMGIPWPKALGAVFVSGFIFFLLVLFHVREAIIAAIPESLKYATSAGIGLFIALIGLKSAGLIVVDPKAGIPRLGSLHDPNVLLALFGLAVTVILLARRVRAAVFYGMVITAIAGMILGLIPAPHRLSEVVGTIPSLQPTLGKLDFSGLWLHPGAFLFVVFTILFVDFFDATGTLLAVGNQAGLLREGRLVGGGRALISDAVAIMIGAWLGTSSTTSYIESSTGVAAGGRTGLTAVTVALLFLLGLFFAPLLHIVTPAVTAPALITVGILMARNFLRIRWDETDEAVPAFLTVVLMPLTYSIANGIAFGVMAYPLLKVVRGRRREVHPVLWGLAGIFMLYFLFLSR
ncbi:NCS2 family permease [Ammonifex thiophilus]|uniref:NCS2 family permease n=1 Tax=Ammonifex thiophilus TaxID=444093 RepID=A0A3D8P861_9THEO|nr:NCS2 family permease [Ammonifex thiophilus]RDV84897.1 NCS2 family permease [Ammonifex thiophilus]